MDGQRAQQYYGLSTNVVIPALNEAQNLQYLLPFIPSLVSEVILVDGHSTDDTIASESLNRVHVYANREVL
jgi:glycosyltransferase involved in cell wall biosynthesis